MSYATEADLYTYGAPQQAFGQLLLATKLAALQSASEIVDTYLRGRYSLPLLAWDISVTEATSRIAAYNLLNIRGYNPASGSDVNLETRYNQAIDWLKLVQKQQAHPNVTPQPNNVPDWNQPVVLSSSVVNLGTGATARKRGW